VVIHPTTRYLTSIFYARGVPVRSPCPMDLNKEFQDGLKNSLFSRSFANLSYLNSHYVVHMHKISSLFFMHTKTYNAHGKTCRNAYRTCTKIKITKGDHDMKIVREKLGFLTTCRHDFMFPWSLGSLDANTPVSLIVMISCEFPLS
jgi:hypothetical protein